MRCWNSILLSDQVWPEQPAALYVDCSQELSQCPLPQLGPCVLGSSRDVYHHQNYTQSVLSPGGKQCNCRCNVMLSYITNESFDNLMPMTKNINIFKIHSRYMSIQQECYSESNMIRYIVSCWFDYIFIPTAGGLLCGQLKNMGAGWGW